MVCAELVLVTFRHRWLHCKRSTEENSNFGLQGGKPSNVYVMCEAFGEPSPITISGAWRASNIKAWQQCHAELWPGIGVPDLLVPISQNRGPGHRAGNELGHFQEATLPTSLAWSCLVSQSSSVKKPQAQRKMASTTFYEVIMSVFRGAEMSLQIQRHNVTERVIVPSTGMVSASLLFGHLSPNQLTAIKQEWAGDCQERGYLRNTL